jgi:hypothetical protein
MEQVANTAATPIQRAFATEGSAGRAATSGSPDFWPSLLMTVALSSIAIGITWDISWHETVGRDTFWTPAHMAIYFGGILAGCVGGWLAFKHTFRAGPAERDSSVSVFGARAPLGAWVAIWGALAMLTSAPFDDWWHNAYGLDVKIVSPPHAVLGLGMFGISVGALLLVLSRQNRLQSPSSSSSSSFSSSSSKHELTSTKGSGMFIYTGGVFVLMGSVFLLEYIFPNMQHAALFYKVCALTYPIRFVALSCAGRISWPATRVAAVYMTFLCVMDWILMQFPAQPKLAPIFNPVTHMVPLPFPLLLIFPALAIDLILRIAGESYIGTSATAQSVSLPLPKGEGWGEGEEIVRQPNVSATATASKNRWFMEREGVRGFFRSIALAILLGAVFFGIFILVQWYFSKFMLSPYARNWFFMSDRVFGYSFPKGEWQTQFWRLDPGNPNFDPLTISSILVTLAFASASSWVGLFFGRWMRKVHR